MKKIICLAIFAFGLVLCVQSLLPTLVYRNINMRTNGDSAANPKTSTIIIEDSSEFLDGTMENLTITDNGYLMLEDKFPFQPDWTNIAPSNQPSGRYGHSMVYNSKHDKIILFGGVEAGGEDDQTWAYDLTINKWIDMDPSNQPSARFGHSMVYNSRHDKVILFGGAGPSVGYGDDETWVYDLETNTWTNMTYSPKPSKRFSHSTAYDSKNDKVILFGGSLGEFGPSDDETWAYDLDTNMWTNMTSSTRPSERQTFSMAYDSKNDKVILFGGLDAGGNDDETWAYELTTNAWTNKAPSTQPSERRTFSMAYDSKNDKVILFGGWDAGGNDDETWAYDLTTNAWTNMNPSTQPSEREYHSMVYNSVHEKLILFGGDDGSLDDETWVFRLYDYHQTGKFDSKIISLDGLHKFSGEISWTPENQTLGTNLTVQFGLSNTINDEDFAYTSPDNSSFTFAGTARYIRYRANFESTDDSAFSPILENVMIVYSTDIVTTQNIVNIDESEGDTTVSEDYLLEMILISCLIGVGSLLALITILYRKKINLLEKDTKLKRTDKIKK